MIVITTRCLCLPPPTHLVTCREWVASSASYEGLLETNVHLVSRKLRHGEGGDIGRVLRSMRAQIRNQLETNMHLVSRKPRHREGGGYRSSFRQKRQTQTQETSRGLYRTAVELQISWLGLMFRQKNTSWGVSRPPRYSRSPRTVGVVYFADKEVDSKSPSDLIQELVKYTSIVD